MGRSQGMTGSRSFLNAIRHIAIEQGLLDEYMVKVRLPSRKQMMSDVMALCYAQRTGGDTLRRLGQADRQEARADLLRRRVWSLVATSLKTLEACLNCWSNLNSDVEKGIEGEAMAELGVNTSAKCRGLT